MAAAVGVVKTTSPPPFRRSQTHPVLARSARVIGHPAPRRQAVSCSISSLPGFAGPEVTLIGALLGVQGRGRSVTPQQLENVERAVKALEDAGGVPDPAVATIKDGKRILFRFDRAAFSFKFSPFKVPYPVPFRLLGDEAKGWLDTTYLSYSGNLHISRGNTTIEPRQKLLSAISAGTMVEEAICEYLSLDLRGLDEECELYEGEWQLIWASQMQHLCFNGCPSQNVHVIVTRFLWRSLLHCFYRCKVLQRMDGLQSSNHIVAQTMTLFPWLWCCPRNFWCTDKKIRISKTDEKSQKGLCDGSAA